MHSAIRLPGFLALVFALTSSGALAGDAVTPPDVHGLIESQLGAFARDDGASAYRLAAPGIQAIFPDAETFMTMVKKSYAPVYRHRSFEFGAFADEGDKVEQALSIVDEDNEVWDAVYTLARQPDGTWRISGCVLIKSEQSSL